MTEMDSSAVDLKDLSIVIVGLNARDFVVGCVESIENAKWNDKSYEVVYSDNGSVDGTVDALRRDFPWVKIIENGSNIGFCKAANIGARASNSRYYYFINDDTLVIDDALSLLVDYMDSHSDVGTAGSRLLYPDMSEQYSGRRFPTLLSSFMGRRSPLTKAFPNAPWVRRYLCIDELERGEPADVDWVSAAGQIVSPKAFWEVGGFDESYYYWHEAVICSRLIKSGYRVVLHPSSKIIHFEGKGSGSRRSYKVKKFHIVDFHRGAYRAYRDHHELNAFHPGSILVRLLLGTRALGMLLIARLSSR
ncbi:glycosyltransferase family 2 protein [Pelagicoccus sp. SDUM812005]|uniref:glycosyltransferase family 2 protein n=1 Tax=Pelagicoccus sp. SDUM812005 TaxID=3041257 RepID=UPI00280EE907|nr:glycosyltransferase family 2 protein [Pelagicoccus sp. SDUM812005]MDQ8180653.1 glycosyltransferase family 2 protein [Pelagicoccus sp. SDUM812005]